MKCDDYFDISIDISGDAKIDRQKIIELIHHSFQRDVEKQLTEILQGTSTYCDESSPFSYEKLMETMEKIDIVGGIGGMDIIEIPYRRKQNRTHRNKRINKKWAKRYGYTYNNLTAEDQIIMIDNKLFVTRHQRELLEDALKPERESLDAYYHGKW
ncbi:MAG: hypothetical protein SFH39_00070 [Candidatus Magnetobacterium sp. LHC-1]